MSAVQDGVIFDFFGIAKNHTLDHALDVVVRPDAEQDPLGSPPALRSQVGSPVDGRPEHVVDAVRVQHKGRVGNVVLAGRLRQRQALLEDAEDGLGHGFGAPRLERATLAEAQMVDQVLAVPALLPHRLQLVLVALGWK